MTREEFYMENEVYLRTVARHYSKNYSVEFDDVFQEGALGMIIAFNSYADKKQEAELVKISRKVANRYMFGYVNKEIKRRSLYQ